MKVSLNWLRDHVELPATVGELTDLLTRAGVEVEGVTTSGVSIPKVVVAQILESQPHPNADRLSVCKVDDGSGTPRQIVCGAKNYRVGDKVPLALPGAVLPGDFKIKVGKLRGVESEGMMCSADELGLPKAADGLLILPAEAVVGAGLADVFPGDTILDIEITPNRPDLLSHFGIAREVAALTGKTATKPKVGPVAPVGGEAVAVTTAKCPIYTLRKISGVNVGPSPAWLRTRLESIGLRAINNVVDVTNLVLFELGQPLHAFDADQLEGDLRVREAADGEEFHALDGRTYRLAAGDIVIADARGPQALGGVMGGEHSGVTAQTTNILLEGAIFEPGAIRRTSRTLGLLSDSSYRFERGVNPAGVAEAAQRAAELIAELAGGVAEITRAGGDRREPPEPACVPLRAERLRALLGTEIPAERVTEILTGFGLEQRSDGWVVPAHRPDLTREADLIEEIARVVGMEAIPARVEAAPAVPGEADEVYDFQMDVRRRLAAQGLLEARTSTLVSEAMAWQGAPAIRLRNPLGEDQGFLRTSLLPGLLAATARNLRHGAKAVRLFEIGRTFHPHGQEETTMVAFVLTGAAATATWRGEKIRPLDIHDARGIFEALVAGPLDLRKTDCHGPLALAADVFVGDARVGAIGQLAPAAARAMDATGPVVTGEISLTALRLLAVEPRFREIPRFPAMVRDLAIICPRTMPYGDLLAALRAPAEPLLEDVRAFDVFTDETGSKLPPDRKSIAISLTFRAPERTLNSDEINAACERLKAQLKRQLEVDFRE